MQNPMITGIDYTLRVLAIAAAAITIPGAWWNVLTPAFWAPFAAVVACLAYALVPRRLAAKSTMLRVVGLLSICLSLLLPAESFMLNLTSKYSEPNWLQSIVEVTLALAMILLFVLRTKTDRQERK
jgi:hypothetical protein